MVNIASSEKVQTQARGGRQFQFQIPPELRGTPFEEFLRRFFQGPDGEQGQGQGPSQGPATALGSGFIIDPAGYVVTNNHVIDNASKIQVTLQDGRKLAAHVVGHDDKTDLALLKVDAKEPLPFVTWGDSDKARVGDWVLAVGNPFGLGGTVTAGIISARGRDIQAGPYDDYLQLDASINRGNSGGPSFNRDGEVIGINTAIFSPNGGSIGIGFAIPSSEAKPIIAELRDHGRIERGWLGVSIQPLTKEIADSVGLGDAKGALIAGVTKDGPAAKAGLHQGDVIRSVNGQKISEFRDLARLIAAIGPNKTATLDVWRDGKDVSVPATLGRMPNNEQASTDGEDHPGRPGAKAASVLGLSLAPINRQTRERFNLSAETKGVLIVGVKSDSPAADAGLQPGDVVVKVGDKTVASPRDLVQSVNDAGKAKRKAVLFLVQREGNERFVAVPLEAS